LYEICLQRFFPFIAIPALEDSVNVVPFIASSLKPILKTLRVVESRATSTCLEIWLNQRLLWKVCWKSSHCYVYNYINYNI